MDKEKLDQIKKVGQKYDLDFIVMFGSQAKGQIITKETDLDIAVYKTGDIKPADFLGLYLALHEILKGQNLDLKILNEADPLLRFQIMKNAVPLYIKNPTFYHEFFSFAYKDFQESQPLFQLTQLMQEKRQKYLEEKYA